MPFFSSAGSRRGSGLGQSILPSSSSPPTKSSRHRKPPRRRNPLKDLIFSNNLIFSITISLSFFFFLAVILRYGIPNPLHRNPRPLSSSSRLRKTSTIRKPISSDRNHNEAVVDLTTKDLYDKIEFLDIDGGPWKQGWMVNYMGNEWDSEKLKVFVVPHSHNDPGWKLTVDEYYDRQSRHILDTIVASLSKDSRRKFIWEEMSYLEKWWRDSSVTKREDFIKLVQNGQLEIVGGGWVMNDEIIQVKI